MLHFIIAVPAMGGGMTALTFINFYGQMETLQKNLASNNYTAIHTFFLIVYTKPKFLVLMASSNFCLRICLEE